MVWRNFVHSPPVTTQTMPRPDGNHRRSALNTKTPAFILAIALFLSAPLRGQQASALEHLAIASDPLLSLLPQHPRLYLKDDQISIAKHNIETDPLPPWRVYVSDRPDQPCPVALRSPRGAGPPLISDPCAQAIRWISGLTSIHSAHSLNGRYMG